MMNRFTDGGSHFARDPFRMPDQWHETMKPAAVLKGSEQVRRPLAEGDPQLARFESDLFLTEKIYKYGAIRVIAVGGSSQMTLRKTGVSTSEFHIRTSRTSSVVTNSMRITSSLCSLPVVKSE